MSKKDSSLKDLQKKLYAKQNTISEKGRKRFSQSDIDVASDWSDAQAENEDNKPEVVEAAKKPMTVFAKMLIASFIFFALAIGSAFVIFTSGQNNVQYDQVNLSILGPNSVPGGETLSFDVMIANDNKVNIELTDLIVQYPSGTYDADMDGDSLTKEIRGVDSVLSGAQTTEKFQAVFFGTEGDTKEIKISYEYRVPGSNAILRKERVYQIRLESSPISVVVTGPQESLSGSDVALDVEVISNANTPLDNVYVQVEYPFGFEFSEADPSPEQDRLDLFKLGRLDVGESRTVKIRGVIRGQDEERRVFKYLVGLFDREKKTIVNTLQQTDSVVAIQKPPVAMRATVNGNPGIIHIVEPGTDIKFDLVVINNLASQIQDTEITAILGGAIFNERGVGTQGFYDSNTNTLRWQKTDIPQLATFESGAQIPVSAGLRLFSTQNLQGIVDPSLSITYKASGTTFDFENKQKPVELSDTVKIKVATELGLETRVLHSIGPFQNTGPLGPVAEETSTYTIAWRATNTTSKITDAMVSVVLPPYVTFLQAEQPDNSVIEFSEQNRTLSWTIPTIVPGAGITEPAPAISFQVSVTPSLSQVGSTLTFTESKKVRGFDTFTETLRVVSEVTNETSRNLERDPSFREGDRQVAAPAGE